MQSIPLDLVSVGVARAAPTSMATLKHQSVRDVATVAVKEKFSRFGNDSSRIVSVLHTKACDMAVLPEAGSKAVGMSVQSAARALSRLCESGLQAIVSAAGAIPPGDCDVADRKRCRSHVPGPERDARRPLGCPQARR